MKNYLLLLPLISMILFSSGAAAESKPLDLSYSSSDIDEPPETQKIDCTLQFAPVKDARINKLTFGAYTLGGGFGEPILSGEIAPWLKAGFQNLGQWGFNVAAEPSVPAAGNKTILIEPTMHYSYLWFASLRMNATLVMTINYQFPTGTQEERAYRVLGSKNNWAGTNGELATTLNFALNKLLTQMNVDLREMCQRI